MIDAQHHLISTRSGVAMIDYRQIIIKPKTLFETIEDDPFHE